ncbi:type III toxin-antitoxin system ToxN/AbiQ family toxin [Clostridium sporogenes]|uniref:type III toxin-antitoxin system ToxN/AbiQ family toxin n=1 Tax=Clostridium sporogenes TaxID=1509 RepID=UPI000717B914|nr:type III toxin-antitoxin system ToxN/AbiQ family toxin [Clostridium sporogenes]KRU40053.1 toxin ToxN [Clostridium sporogenes]MBY7065208.1 type III toxin-antitoxin system ToxN/AbiQ family toxin [Clostridium sporogenes]MBY7071822.1 type III toxin-antitoxin system ToxN/AbiQ family toxin [Clostridium sporogenes]MCW6065880.1 type III toxin-antitoxin system ToxN/AbiQ family toxin [Clostridium sporogenes]OQP88549.1 toxin ToxN [Clostridium sporogenes]
MKPPQKNKILFKVSDSYINKLQDVDYRVQNNYNNERLYFKTNLGFETEEGVRVDYLVPLSSSKEKQKHIDNKTLFKIYGSNTHTEDFLGVLHLNNMIPVPEFETQEWSPNEPTIDERYKMMVIKQANYLRKNQNKVNENTKLLYDSKIGNVDKEFFKKNRNEVMFYKRIVTNVQDLEKACIEHIHGQNINSPQKHFDYEI